MSNHHDEQSNVLTKQRTKKPRRYKVLIHNDDYSSMEFVVEVLRTIFKHSAASSTRLMLQIHKSGLGIAGVYSREIAETRLEQVMMLSRESQQPLQCTMEAE